MTQAQFFALPRLIGLGFEKCGTTNLNALLAGSPHFLTPLEKETFFFSHHYDGGMELRAASYDLGSKPTAQCVVDITPYYIRDGARTLGRMKEFEQLRGGAPNRYLFCLRNQVERAFSHYVHELYYHWSRFERGTSPEEPYRLTFFEEYERGNDYLFTRYADFIELAFDMLGRENVLVVLNEEFRAPTSVIEKTATFLGVDARPKAPSLRQRLRAFRRPAGGPQRRVLAGHFPRFHYRRHGEQLLDRLDGTTARLLRGHLYLIADGSEIDLGPRESVEPLMEAYRRWTRWVSGIDAERIYMEYFEEDRRRLEQLLGIDLGRWRSFKDLSY